MLILKRQLPPACFVGDVASRRAAYLEYERACWADAVEYRGLSLLALDLLDQFAIESELDRRRVRRQ